MSLNWQFHDKERFKKIEGDPMNDVFIWGCMFVGLTEISEKNAVEWLDRYTLYDSVAGPFYYADGEKRERLVLTLEDVRKRIGLRTNAGNITKTAFLTKVWKSFVENQAKARKEEPKKLSVV